MCWRRGICWITSWMVWTAAAQWRVVLRPGDPFLNVGVRRLEQGIELATLVIVKTGVQAGANLSGGQTRLTIDCVYITRFSAGIYTCSNADAYVNTARTKYGQNLVVAG